MRKSQASSAKALADQSDDHTQLTIAMAVKACIRPSNWDRGAIVAKVYAYQVKWPDPKRLQTELLEIIDESNRRAVACPWVET